jgi:hypothetical protein
MRVVYAKNHTRTIRLNNLVSVEPIEHISSISAQKIKIKSMEEYHCSMKLEKANSEHVFGVPSPIQWNNQNFHSTPKSKHRLLYQIGVLFPNSFYRKLFSDELNRQKLKCKYILGYLSYIIHKFFVIFITFKFLE